MHYKETKTVSEIENPELESCCYMGSEGGNDNEWSGGGGYRL